MTAMQALKAATASAHQKLEAIVDSRRVLDSHLTLAEFQAMLLGNYHLHRLLEPQIANCLSQSLPEFNYAQERLKLHLLQADLTELGAEITVLTHSTFSIDDLASALGAAYVLEGSTLGGQVIRRALLRHPELSRLSQFHYYNCYAADLRARWVEFSQSVNEELQSEAEIERACETACRTFELACDIFALCCGSVGSKNSPKEVLV